MVAKILFLIEEFNQLSDELYFVFSYASTTSCSTCGLPVQVQLQWALS